MSDCLFCAIAAGSVAAEIVLESEDIVAFLDTRPVFKGHVLLVPRTHVATLPDLPDDLALPFVAAGRRLATAMVAGWALRAVSSAPTTSSASRCPTCTYTSSRAPRATACGVSSGRGSPTTRPRRWPSMPPASDPSSDRSRATNTAKAPSGRRAQAS